MSYELVRAALDNVVSNLECPVCGDTNCPRHRRTLANIIASFHRALASTAEPWFILGPYQYTRGASVALANVVERIGEERTQ